MGISFIRTAILYIFVVAALRIMGKRQLGELQPSELVVAIMISDLATVPMQSKRASLLEGIVPIFTLVSLEILLSVLVLKSEKLRRLITGSPTKIIENGHFLQHALASLRLCTDDVTEQLRLAGYSDITQIDSAVIETNGQISILPKEASRPVTCHDLKIKPPQQHFPHTVISDGKMRLNNLRSAGVNREWLKKKLSEYNVTDINSVFYMSVSDDKKIFLQIKE